MDATFESVADNAPGIYTSRGYIHPGEWHSTIEEAQARVKEMAIDELSRLEKQAAKLKAIVEGGVKVKT